MPLKFEEFNSGNVVAPDLADRVVLNRPLGGSEFGNRLATLQSVVDLVGSSSVAWEDITGAVDDNPDLIAILDSKAIPELLIRNLTDSYTLVLSDRLYYVRLNKATAVNLTVPPNSSAAFPIGTQIPIRQVGAGQLTVVAGSGVTINTSQTLKLLKQKSTATLIKVGTDEWDLAGELEAAP